jgi:hypothetical protein
MKACVPTCRRSARNKGWRVNTKAARSAKNAPLFCCLSAPSEVVKKPLKLELERLSFATRLSSIHAKFPGPNARIYVAYAVFFTAAREA